MTPKPLSGDNLGNPFYFTAKKYHALQEAELECEWRELYPDARPIKSLETTVRRLSIEIADIAHNVLAAMAAACSNSDTKVSAKDLQDLAQVSSPAFKAIRWRKRIFSLRTQYICS